MVGKTPLSPYKIGPNLGEAGAPDRSQQPGYLDSVRLASLKERSRHRLIASCLPGKFLRGDHYLGVPKPAVDMPTAEDLETGLWSPERAAGGKLPPSFQARASPNGCTSPTSLCPRATNLPRTPPSLPLWVLPIPLPRPLPQPSRQGTPDPLATPGMKGKAVSSGNPNPPLIGHMDDQPMVAASKKGCGPIGRACVQGKPCSKHFGDRERSRDSRCRSDGESSGGAEDAANKAESCRLADEYTSVF